MKRLFLATGAALALCPMAPIAAQAQPAAVVSAQAPRESVLLKDGWRFRQSDTLTGAERPDFADGDWEQVSVPHTWNRVGYYIPDSGFRVNTPQTVNKTQGVGWYRLNFTPPASLKGKRAWLQFDAASRTAEVWLNGVRLGAHAGGFSRFRLDATDAIKAGQSNLLVVKTDNSKPAVGSPTADVLPISGDFFVHGGLYRPVNLIVTDAVHIDMLDHGGPGVYATTASIEGGAADVAVRTEVRNDGQAAARLSVVAQLVDAGGAVAAEAVASVTVSAGEAVAVPQSLRLAKAHLWQGVADPYLYRLVVEVRRGGGGVDRLEQPFGVRQMRFDAKSGFFLNGKPLRLHGVAMHQDREGKGWAISYADTAADMDLIREMGANTIRLAHYQHGPDIHELADRYGLILWDEIPLVSAWTLAPGQTEASPGLLADARQQLQELIRQNYNHASVAVWGIANEVDFGNAIPAFLSGSGGAPDPLPLLQQLNALAKAEDPSRPTVLATCCEGRLFGGPDAKIPIVAPVADLSGANRYYGWYYDEPSGLDQHLEAIRAKRPDQPLAITEYGAGGAVSMHTDNPLGGPIDSRGRNQPEEYQSYVHEETWPILASKTYLWSTWLWNSFDFASTSRHEGDAEDINTKGLISYDHNIKKDAFFFYKANWTQTPTVHINGRRYIDRAYAVTDVRVYSNAATTELSVNGKPLGSLTQCPQMICVWKDVRLPTGAISMVATGRFPGGETTDKVDWTLSPQTASHIRIDSGAQVAGPSATGRFGSDNYFLGGQSKSVNSPADFGKPAEIKAIQGATDAVVAATYRVGDFRYRVPLENGRYTVTLTFIEPSEPAKARLFDVLANGAPKLSRLDVAAAAGGPLTQLQRSFPVVVTGGVLDLQFKPIKGEAVVSAVEIIR